MVCGLDHSGSQPFNYNKLETAVQGSADRLVSCLVFLDLTCSQSLNHYMSLVCVISLTSIGKTCQPFRVVL